MTEDVRTVDFYVELILCNSGGRMYVICYNKTVLVITHEPKNADKYSGSCIK